MNKLPTHTVFDLKEFIDIKPGRIASRSLSLPNFSSSTAQESVLYAMGQEETISSETSPLTRLVHVLEGALDMVVEQQACHLRAGDSLVIPAGTWHEFAAPTGCKFLQISY
ncbi:cupin domain-containing protein [Paenibacillus senegalimassiliensis]|uniref:cupin domain-containing protein n=1 Tax=Paenibacillus senegalimassiliensis TaxID=1737426 RepID=UPI00073E4FEF|nr:cupin domain-containing protein [Paenibacillus senegalimassiliensis]